MSETPEPISQREWMKLGSVGRRVMDWYGRGVRRWFEVRCGEGKVAEVEMDLVGEAKGRVCVMKMESGRFEMAYLERDEVYELTRERRDGRVVVGYFRTGAGAHEGEVGLRSGRVYRWMRRGGGLFRLLRGHFEDGEGRVVIRFWHEGRHLFRSSELKMAVEGEGVEGIEALLMVGFYLLEPGRYSGWKEYAPPARPADEAIEVEGEELTEEWNAREAGESWMNRDEEE